MEGGDEATPEEDNAARRRPQHPPMTSKLDETTGFVAFMAELSGHKTVQAAVQAGVEEAVHATALITRIKSTWEAQLSEEQKQRDAAQARQQSGRRGADAEGPPKKKPPKDPNCLACQGRHRPHTCK